MNTKQGAIGHFFAAGITVGWMGIVVKIFLALSGNEPIQWLWLIFAGWATTSVLVELTQFESLVAELRDNKFTLWKAVKFAFDKTWSDTMSDVFSWNLTGAFVIGVCLLAFVF